MRFRGFRFPVHDLGLPTGLRLPFQPALLIEFLYSVGKFLIDFATEYLMAKITDSAVPTCLSNLPSTGRPVRSLGMRKRRSRRPARGGTAVFASGASWHSANSSRATTHAKEVEKNAPLCFKCSACADPAGCFRTGFAGPRAGWRAG